MGSLQRRRWVGGSEYDTAIRWTPSTAQGEVNSSFPAGTTAVALEDNSIGDFFFDFQGGLKFAITENLILSRLLNLTFDDIFNSVELLTMA